MKTKIILTSLFVLTISIQLCDNENKKESISFTYDVKPIFELNCIECHGQNGSANLNLSTYEDLMSGESNNGPVVIPYQPENSLLYQKIASDNPPIGQRMPYGRNQLSHSDISIIEQWILEGAKDN